MALDSLCNQQLPCDLIDDVDQNLQSFPIVPSL